MTEQSCMPGPSSLTSDITQTQRTRTSPLPNKTNSTESDYRFREENSELPKAPINASPGALQLHSWLNKSLRIEMTDGRVLVGVFLCTDRDANIILGSCSEYLPEGDEEPRMLGLVMIPGKHIVTVHINVNTETQVDELETALPKNVRLCEASLFN